MELTLQFLAVTLLLEITPGPAMLFVLYQSAHGYRYVLAGILGLLTANFVWISLVATGLGLLITQSPTAYEILRYLGAAYLAYMGYKICRYGIGKQQPVAGTKPKKYWKIYLQGVLTSLSNPKALLFFLALFPNFTREQFFVEDILYFGALKLVCLFIVMTTYGLIGSKVFDYVNVSKVANIIGRSLGLGIVGAAIAIARG
ncbi:MAG: LysE family translocator [Pseudomonadales bacterium]|nr:LysE family translocator [Pseudomonadales bacterium]NRA17249.1 LysE family translocator [Oceanospirillaceae bacterium]